MKLPLAYLIENYQGNLFATAFNLCKNTEDAKDLVQETFLAYYQTTQQFKDESHIRAWLFRVVINKSKDLNKSFWHRNKIPLEDYIQSLPFEGKEESDLLETVLKLLYQYRIVIHLYYYEDYSIKEISEILHMKENAVKTRLSRGRKQLKQRLKEEWSDDE